MRLALTSVFMTCAVTFSLAAAPGGTADVKASLGLTKDQEQRLYAQEKAKSSAMKSLRDSQDGLISQLAQQVTASAPESQLSATFSQIKTGQRSIGATELAFWDSLATFLTATQEAKVFLRSHPPKTSAPANAKPPEPAKNAAPDATMTPQAWKTFFGASADQHQKLEAANKAKAATVKPLRENQEAAIEHLRQQVEAGAPDGDIKTALASVVSIMRSIHDAENGHWDTVGAFLTPTQAAKLFLRQHHKI